MSRNEMSEEYRKFAEGAPGLRKITLQFMKLNPESALPLFEQVYQFDPDPEIRQIALDVLRSQGQTPAQDRDPDDIQESTARAAYTAQSREPIQAPVSALRDAGIGGIKADDALSRGEALARRSFAADRDDSPAPSLTTPFAMPDLVNANGTTLDGGTGRPVQRGPHLAGVFTINKANIKYLVGEKDRPASEFWGFIVGIAITAIVIGIMFFADTQERVRSMSSDRPPWEFILPISIGFDFLLVVLMVRSSRQAKYFHENGQLLVGQIVSAHGRWVTTGSGKSRSRNYKVTLNYRIRLPDGEVRDASDTQNRNDLARQGVPEPGAPIAALVLPDTKKMRLL